MTAPQALVPLEKTSLRAGKQFTHAVGGYFEVSDNSLLSSAINPSVAVAVAISSTLSNSSYSRIGTGTRSGTEIGSSHQSVLSEIQKGRIVVFGDSSCFEQEPTSRSGCEKLLTSFLDFIDHGTFKIPDLSISKSTTNSSKNSYFELLKDEEYYQRNLMDLSRPLSKSETAQLNIERKARAWEFSRYAKRHVHYLFIVHFAFKNKILLLLNLIFFHLLLKSNNSFNLVFLSGFCVVLIYRSISSVRGNVLISSFCEFKKHQFYLKIIKDKRRKWEGEEEARHRIMQLIQNLANYI